MKNKIFGSLLIVAAAPLLASCLQEAMPTDTTIQKQVDTEEGKEGLANAIPYYLNSFSTDNAFDIGFAAFKIWRDASTGDMPVYSLAYDYYSYVAQAQYLGADWTVQYTIWQRYYSLIQKCNLLMKVITDDKTDAAHAATAIAYRANAYMEMAEWYEYKLTGYPALDDKAISDGLLGLTVPIVTENTTEQEARNNPRAPFYELYRFVLTDLNRGEKCVYGMSEPSSKMYAGRGLIYGLLARFWLTVGTRFERYPEDLSTALQHEDDSNIAWDKLNVTDAAACFSKAAEYARKAINVGYTPYSKEQWFDPKNGFNTPNNSWIWANIISPDNGLATTTAYYQSWASYMTPETEYGVSNPDYLAYRMIDARLFSQIDDADWRKTTWIDPKDAADESAYNSKYARGTNLEFRTWKKIPAYVGFKFHPAQGNISTSNVGNAVSIPLMRVEEMYLIEAEAVGRAQGDGAGRQLLEAFVNGYRYNDGSYKSKGEGFDGFIQDVYDQKRIELWGEGLVMFDMRRLGMPVTRGYDGTNFAETTRFNTLPGYVAPWSTFCIPQSERDFNPAVKLNPDPSHTSIYEEWTGN